jgi:hypothetical protein
VVRGNASINAALAELVSSGAGVLAVCADASRRASLAAGATGLARFNGGAALVACHRCGREAIGGLARRASGGLALTDYAALAVEPELAAAFEHIVLVDPPASAAERALAASPRNPGEPLASPSPGFLHQLYTDAERDFSLAVLESRAPSRKSVATAFRALREAGDVSGAGLREALCGTGPYPLCPEAAARCLRVLRELDLVRGEPNRGDGVVGVVSSGGTDLERSAAFRSYSEEFSEAQRFLERPKLP